MNLRVRSISKLAFEFPWVSRPRKLTTRHRDLKPMSKKPSTKKYIWYGNLRDLRDYLPKKEKCGIFTYVIKKVGAPKEKSEC